MKIDSEEIKALTRIIMEEYHPDSIILFGSQTRGNAGEDSDIDLLVISDREKDLPRPHRGRELRQKLAKTRKPYDLLIYTRAELVRGWLRKAEHDLKNAQIVLQDPARRTGPRVPPSIVSWIPTTSP